MDETSGFKYFQIMQCRFREPNEPINDTYSNTTYYTDHSVINECKDIVINPRYLK